MMLRWNLDPARTAALIMGLFAAALLASALVIQYAFGAQPCRLCVWQRYPHLALMALGLVGTFVWPRAALAAGGLIALGSVGLALYHVGIEQGFWALPAGCAAGTEARSVEELRRLLAEAPPTCDQVSFTLIGLSLAMWNAIASLMLVLLAVIALSRITRPEAKPAQ